MKYRAFSDPKNIDKMTRILGIWPEQETLEVTMFSGKDVPFKNYGHWVKYVSTEASNKLQVYLYWDTKIQEAWLKKEIWDKLLANKNLFAKIEKAFKRYYRDFKKLTDRYNRLGAKYFNKLSNRELLDHFEQFCYHSRRALIGYYLVFDVTDALSRFVKEEFLQQFPDQEKLFEQLAKAGITSNLGIKQQTTEKIEAKKLLQQIKKYPALYNHIIWLRKMMGYRNNESVLIEDYYDQAKALFNEMAKRLNISYDDFWYLSKEEIVGGLKNKIKVPPIIKERKVKGFTIKQVGKKIKVWTGVRPEDWHEEASAANLAKKELKGSPAFVGKVTGRVKIIYDSVIDGPKINFGDILVTPMTTPDFVPLMKKAGGVVTDEGGLLCHAAIVARELKKPTIIGTREATKVLHDGDLIELDAGQGIIRILN